jgi:uncharacterized membrane protein (UPF0127 family)
MRKIIILIVAILVIASAAYYIQFYTQPVNQHPGEPTNYSRICFDDNCFQIELAITPAEQSRGLMYRDQLDPDRGMLFVFQTERIYPFWMKNTLIPLDIIWIDNNLTVVHIEENAQPCSPLSCSMITPDHEAKYVLEINGGLVDRIALGIGDDVIMDYL